jgi:uncharacterized protein (TIGR00369 family)
MSDSEQERTRTYGWSDPRETLARFKAQRPLDVLRAVVAEGAPFAPIAQTMGFTLVEVSEGHAVFELTPAEYHYNPVGIVHGGVAATMLDSAVGISILSSLPAGMTFTTLEIKVNYLRPMTAATGPVRAEGSVIHLGRQTAVAEARITDVEGKLFALASTTCLIMPLEQRR